MTCGDGLSDMTNYPYNYTHTHNITEEILYKYLEKRKRSFHVMCVCVYTSVYVYECAHVYMCIAGEKEIEREQANIYDC